MDKLEKNHSEIEVALLPTSLQRHVNELPDSYWEMCEEDLRKEMTRKHRYQESFSVYHRIKISFWNEYDLAVTENRRMLAKNIFEGCTTQQFYHGLISSCPAFVVWMVTRSPVHKLKLAELGELSDERMLNILSVNPIYTYQDVEKVDSKLATVQVKLYEIIQNRIHGSVVERQEVHSKNFNMNLNQSQALQAAEDTALDSMEKILAKLKEVEEKRAALNSMRQPIQLETAQLMKPDPTNNRP